MYEHFTKTQQQFNVRRGDVYYINNNRGQRGNEIRKDRPAVIVSADFLNKHSGDVVVVFLTSQPKKDMSTHVTIRIIMEFALIEESLGDEVNGKVEKLQKNFTSGK